MKTLFCKKFLFLLLIVYFDHTLNAVEHNNVGNDLEISYVLEPLNQKEFIKLLKLERIEGLTLYLIDRVGTEKIVSKIHLVDELMALCERFQAIQVKITNNSKQSIKIPTRNYFKNFVNLIISKEEFIESCTKIVQRYLDSVSMVDAYVGLGLAVMCGSFGLIPFFAEKWGEIIPFSAKLCCWGLGFGGAALCSAVALDSKQIAHKRRRTCRAQKVIFKKVISGLCNKQPLAGESFELNPGETLLDTVFLDTEKASEIELLNTPAKISYSTIV